ncbi:6282_t:CDS:2, partial [Paraglomus occultum]
KHLAGLPTMSIWNSNLEDNRRSAFNLEIPSFSLQPSKYISLPYADSSTVDADDNSNEEESSDEDVVHNWMASIARGTMFALIENILSIPQLSSHGIHQLSTDLGYLTKVLSTLDVSPIDALGKVFKLLDMDEDVMMDHILAANKRQEDAEFSDASDRDLLVKVAARSGEDAEIEEQHDAHLVPLDLEPKPYAQKLIDWSGLYSPRGPLIADVTDDEKTELRMVPVFAQHSLFFSTSSTLNENVGSDDTEAKGSRKGLLISRLKKIRAEKVGAEKVGAEKVGAEKVGAEKVGAEKVAAEKVATENVTEKVGASETIDTSVPTMSDSDQGDDKGSMYGEKDLFGSERGDYPVRTGSAMHGEGTVRWGSAIHEGMLRVE